jgi:hypothetical protein
MLQGWLAILHAGSGYAKISEPIDSLAWLMACPGVVDPGLVRLLGVGDIAFVLGPLTRLLWTKPAHNVLAMTAVAMAAS